MRLERSSLSVDNHRGVVVDAKEVDRRGDGRQVSLLYCGFQARSQLLICSAEARIAPLEQRIEIETCFP